MAQTVEQLAQSFRHELKATPGPGGRRRVCELLQKALRDPAFIAATFNVSTPERQLLHEDPELGFCILAHYNQDAKHGAPHDHGPSWAIYGQAAGETQMTDWDVVEPASADQPGKVRHRRTYKLAPGQVHLYNEGDVHSPSRAAPTRLLRIEGTNLERVRRRKYEII